MTISPPSNVKLLDGEPARILAANIDTLRITFDVEWQSERTLEKLAELKNSAAADEKDATGGIKPSEGAEWVFLIRPFGRDGYEWLLDSSEYALSIGNWMNPKTRPSIIADIRSETLWTHGPAEAVERLRSLIDAMQGKIVREKVSRVDPCVDLLMPVATWNDGLRDQLVTRAAHVAPYFNRGKLTGLQIGKGNVSARFYNKPLEIQQKSRKFWMYDVWRIDAVPDGHRIIRVEFQVRREAVKALGIDSFADLEKLMPELWAYLTQRWLRLADDAKVHHTMQAVVPWWLVVQAGLPGAAAAHPLIRAKAVREDEEHVYKQLFGYLSKLIAIQRQGDLIEPGEVLDMQSHLGMLLAHAQRYRWTDEDFTERVKRKQAETMRHKEKFQKAASARAQFGVSLRRPNRRPGP